MFDVEMQKREDTMVSSPRAVQNPRKESSTPGAVRTMRVGWLSVNRRVVCRYTTLRNC